MSKKCLNRECVLRNLVYNLVINNILSGLGSMLRGNIDEMLRGFILLGLGILLTVAVRKDNTSLLLAVLILEPFVLAFDTIRITSILMDYAKGITKNLDLLVIFGLVGLVVMWVLMIPTFMFYKDLELREDEAKTNSNENKQNCDNESLRTTVV